jgi:hypothetical protein
VDGVDRRRLGLQTPRASVMDPGVYAIFLWLFTVLLLG